MAYVSDYERTLAANPKDLPKGLDAVAHSVAGTWERRKLPLKKLRIEAEAIQDLAAGWRDSKDGVLAAAMRELAAVFARQSRDLGALEHKALGMVVEAARRKLGLSAHTEQIMGALAIRRGYLAEMATGEGKTLAIALAAAPNGWTGLPCHVITANDYLAKRDAKSLGAFYRFCGVAVSSVTGDLSQEERRANYEAGVVYTTAKDVVADYLRDRLRLGTLAEPGRRLIRAMLQPRRTISQHIVMRGLHTAIVDEADHAMIDEAVTPLIISRQVPNEPLVHASTKAHAIAGRLRKDEDYRANVRYREIEFMDGAEDKIAEAAERLPGIWQGRQRRIDLVRQALQAREFFHRDQQYVISDGKLIIVDESTGRLMPQRTWSEGLHQAIEAKEGLEISSPAETMARLSFQRFFRLFHNLSGLTGTAAEAGSEFWHIYRLPVIQIPHHRPCIRKVMPEQIHATTDGKWRGVIDEILKRHAKGQPVLVGTRNVEASEHLSKLLKREHVTFSVLNATRHEQEAAIIARAGEHRKITIATNMAGRGTDIRLGPGVVGLGGLHVIATERHESRRVDRQLFGRAARQGDPGSVQAFCSLEDHLLCRHVPKAVRLRVQRLLKAGLPSAGGMAAAITRFAQKSSQRFSYQQRRNVLRSDLRLDESLGFTEQ
jgi:preprotein translocase subunit SecA